jgi:hypothetical protein
MKLPFLSLPFPSLPFPSLPFPSLPFRALRLISEYSKPLTRPDWRTCKRLIRIEEYIYTIRYGLRNKNTKLLNLISNNMSNTDFYIAFDHIYFFGIDSYCLKYELNKKDVLSNKKLNRQNDLYQIRFNI